MPNWQESFVTSSNGASIETRYLQGDPSRLAFIAHPLGRLGGSFEDHVVTGLAKHLCTKHNYTIVLMNSRGVGKSTGRASFSLVTYACKRTAGCPRLNAGSNRAIPEAEDYQFVVNTYTGDIPSGSDVLLCGYSAGAFSASCASVHQRMTSRYLLISYPVSVLFALTLFRTSPFHEALSKLKAEYKPVLSIRGDQDQFTSSVSYGKWETGLGQGDSITCRTVKDADHFWRDKACMASLLKCVDEWLESSIR